MEQLPDRWSECASADADGCLPHVGLPDDPGNVQLPDDRDVQLHVSLYDADVRWNHRTSVCLLITVLG